MRKLQVLFLCIGFILPGSEIFSQEYFSQSYDITGYGLWSYGTTVLTNDSGYLIGAETCWPNSTGKRRISLVQLDLQGNQKWIRYYDQGNNNGFGIGIGFSGFLTKTYPEGYAITGVRRDPYPGWIRDQGILFRLTENYDTIWTKLYGDRVEPCDTELLLRQVRQISTGGFVLYGQVMYYNDQRMHLTIIKTDLSGNKIWQKFYGQPPYSYFGYSFAVTSDRGFVLGGSRWFDNAQSYDPIIFKIDSVGNEQWFLNLGSEFMDYAAFVDTIYDGNIIVGTVIADSSLGNDSYYGRICFTKLDNDGSIIWQRKYGSSNVNDQLWSIKSLPDGKIAATGSGYRYYPGSGPEPRIGWIILTNAEGDSLWYREYSLVQGENSTNFLYDIVHTNDSGFIACGYVNPVYPDPGPQSTWVIKVDSLGCESPSYCWVNVEEEEEEAIPAEKGKMVLFPNPAIDILNLRMTGDHFKQGTELLFYNIYGQVQERRVVTTASEILQFNVAGWPPGIYVVRILSKGALVAAEKFVVE